MKGRKKEKKRMASCKVEELSYNGYNELRFFSPLGNIRTQKYRTAENQGMWSLYQKESVTGMLNLEWKLILPAMPMKMQHN